MIGVITTNVTFLLSRLDKPRFGGGRKSLFCQVITDIKLITYFPLYFVTSLCYYGHMSKSEKRPQAQKEYVQHVQNLRRGSTTDRHRSPRDYRRKPKHVNRQFD